MKLARWSDTLRWTFEGSEGAGGRVVSASILAGGICGGGLLIGTLAMTGRGSPGLHLLLAPVLFLAGSLAGFLLGLGISVAAHPGKGGRSASMKRGLLAATFTVPLLPLSWLVSSSITVSTALQVERRASWVVVSAVGVLLGVGICGLAAREIWLLIRDHARGRSTGRKQGSATAAATPYNAE